MRAAFLLAVLAACSGKKSTCELAVHHVMSTVGHAGPPGSEPKAQEQAVIDQIEAQTIVQCAKEGLSDEQLACVMAIKGAEELSRSSECAAIKANHPSWLLTPP
ncbi:hypothetical protein BH11MYX1_BH11MYX1_29620 [soil metagenome]